MRKAVSKRIKFTKTGKMLHRQAGLNHFNAKMSRRAQRRKKATKGFSPTITKKMLVYLG